MLCSRHIIDPCCDFHFDSTLFIPESEQSEEGVWLCDRSYRRHPRSNPIVLTMASANRIRERYLHQLGLQRGGGVGGIPTTLQTQQQPQHVVVISGLPSLPEDRATTTTDLHGQQHLLESHDFSVVSRLSHHTHENASSVDDGEEEVSWSGNSGRCAGNVVANYSFRPSISPSRLTSMALPCPMALKNIPLPPSKPKPSPTNAALSSSLPFTLSHWHNSSLSKSASVLLDSAEYDSACSVGTCTTAESSLMLSRDWGAFPLPNSSCSSRAHHTSSAAASISSSTQGERSVSPVSSFTPGVHFQQRNTAATTPPVIGSSSFCSTQGQQQSRGGGGGCATTSSLAHALHSFKIDSDCEASLASNSIIEDHTAMMMEDNEDDAASRSSISSYISAGTSSAGVGGGSSSIKSQHSSSHHHPKKNKVVSMKAHHHHPAACTSIDRATAHERILKVRSDHSMKMRANLAQSHRNKLAVAGNLSLIMAQGGISSSTNISSGMVGSSGCGDASSLPLEHHVHHGGGSSSSGQTRPNHPYPSSPSITDRVDRVCSDLGRTPTASNCASDLQKVKELGLVMMNGCAAGGGSISSSNIESSLLSAGVHISQDRSCYPYPKGVRHQQQQHLSRFSSSWRGAVARPLQVHPELVYHASTPPPKLWMTLPQSEDASPISRTSTTEQEVESRVDGGASNEDSTSSSLHHTNHSIEDVMEVAMTLSKLGGAGGRGGMARNGPIPRFR